MPHPSTFDLSTNHHNQGRHVSPNSPKATTWAREIVKSCLPQCKSTHAFKVYHDQPVENRLSGEVNVESILALEEEIKEHEKTLSKLKRSRNALLNISTLPPEVLGNIFQCNVTLEDNFGGLEEGSHNFLFVCHHWHEVALRTPGVWSFWGNTLADWARWYRRSGTAPLDLVLDAGHSNDDDDNFGDDPSNVAVREALQDRAARDAIRRIHLMSYDPSLLSSIVSSLAAAWEGVRPNSVESLILVNGTEEPVDVSEFFAHYRFPKLQYFELHGCRITSWDLLASRTAVLTTLSIHFDDPTPTPTTSQLLSMLAFNPSLRKLTLSGYAIPNDGGGGSPLRVPLHHLEELQLAGGLQHILGLLHRLDHPGNMDHLDTTLFGCAVTDIPQTIGPYLRDHLRRRGRPRDGLGLRVSQSPSIKLSVGDMRGTVSHGPGTPVNWFIYITVKLGQIPRDLLEKGVFDLIAHTPRDDVVHFEPLRRLPVVGGISAQFPYLKSLQFVVDSIPLSIIFPEPKAGGDDGVPPSLQHIRFLNRPDGDDWRPLTAFLARRASSGDRFGSLMICCHVCLEVREYIRSVVQVFHYVDRVKQCPFGICPE